MEQREQRGHTVRTNLNGIPLTHLPGYFCMILLPDLKAALVDSFVWVQIRKFNWRVKKSRGGWYAYTRTKRNGRTFYTYMHRLVMGSPPDLQVHHKNRNTLDNRIENLEIVTGSEHQIIKRRAAITKFVDEIPFKTLCGLNPA